MPAISTSLWFDGNAVEAARHYTSIFPNSRIEGEALYNEEGFGQTGDVMTVSFFLDEHHFIAINGGPYFTFTPAISMFVHCADQEEVDHYWTRLSDGGSEGQCGWLTDRFGVSWQIVPNALPGLIGGPDEQGAARATAAMLKMGKLDIAALQAAYDG